MAREFTQICHFLSKPMRPEEGPLALGDSLLALHSFAILVDQLLPALAGQGWHPFLSSHKKPYLVIALTQLFYIYYTGNKIGCI